MARDIFINGETLVTVGSFALGYTDQQIHIKIKNYFQDLRADDYADKVPADVMYLLSDAEIDMTLVHYDEDALFNTCLKGSMGNPTATGEVSAAGTILGSAMVKLQLSSPVGNKGWTFPTAFLAETPTEIPIGTERSLVHLVWRAIPWGLAGVGADPTQISSANAVLWTNP